MYARHDQRLGGESPLWRLMAPTTSQWQLRRREAGWEGSRRRNRDPRNTWRARIACGRVGCAYEAGRPGRAGSAWQSPMSIKGPSRRRGGCAVKPDVSPPERSSDPAPDGTTAHPAEAGSLWEQFVSRGNLAEALRRVEQNAGAPGIDGMSAKELRPWLKDRWPEVRSQLEAGTYRPQPVRRVMIPKPSGGLRMLGVPAAVDRLICQAIAQVLTPVFDPRFHPHSFGYRPGRSQHHAVERARQFIADDAAWCVDF